MKAKLLNLALIIASLFGYLAWGADQKMYLYEIEMDFLQKLIKDPLSVLHPFTILPLLGQLLLLITLFQKQASKRLTYLGIGGLGILLGFMAFIGIIAQNPKIFLSALPFLILAMVAIRYHKKATY